ncbi:NADPH-dependent assimilatory sulfite reductase hemoprotein subunit [Synoicihabitans lomoniglobus]|uniref:assimilatory sulfite reductase (NADPH) n=1 Tax=Synoicihabitans lomoniglobus TaxID=2909285 RepID=A0AAF0I558_9BACT|nr:NADPH-dependent assimilatory sulfite reductase hemoprotein subunit [Opitutaceae bacterium LMO-M01]WED67124.1 NADPH-dependent assimilatory sulfite reductase hemoprotein subunit [Opitutaceae bacterium LMO-M01]
MSTDTDAPKPLAANEGIKTASNFLRGTIAEELKDTSTGAISEDNQQLTKFHGLYLQDDRDVRIERRRAKLEKAFSFMLRVRLPGGRCSAAQWLVLDKLADEQANGSLRLTTRQTFQFHGILKGNLKPLIKGMHATLLDSIAACGDVNRNIMAPANPERSPAHAAMYDHAKNLSDYALPKTRAYHEIWLDDELVAGGEPEVEPLYGPTYLPRKFKVGFAIPPSNDVDVYSQDLGYIGIVENGQLVGYNVTMGGGLGMSHGNEQTHPRLADLVGFITCDQVNAVGAAVIATQRDYGDRTNRKHARLKYTIEDRGIDWFKAEVEKRSGVTFGPAREFAFTTIQDPHGWHECADGTWFYGLHILSGRIKDRDGWLMKTALREVAEIHTGDFRLTPTQNVTISGVTAEGKAAIEAILAKYGLDKENERSPLRLNAMSCVALPTCGLALAESERVLPEVIERFEAVLESAGLSDDAISLRMTGCPNGCARPYLAEIGFVGKAPGKYALYIGAKYNGSRLNRMISPKCTIDEALEMLTPIINRYAKERSEGEEFGDFCERVILPADATFHSVGTVEATA